MSMLLWKRPCISMRYANQQGLLINVKQLKSDIFFEVGYRGSVKDLLREHDQGVNVNVLRLYIKSA